MYRVRLQEKCKTYSTPDEKTGCWNWNGQISNSGHGKLTIRDRVNDTNVTLSAETASYMAFVGEIPEGNMVRQTCGNRLCVNPEHLEMY